MFLAFVAAAAVAAPEPAPIDPVSWFSADDYPLEAQKEGMEGTVTIDLGVDRDGKPTSCRIVSSSGFKLLDQATCKAAEKKARFTPAIGANGHPVASHYTQKATWRVPNKWVPSYRAVILDFSADPLHPVCTIQSKGDSGYEPTCAEVQAQVSAGAPRRLKKLVYLVSTTPDGEAPYRGEPDWGARISYTASDQYYLKGSFPVACVSVATDGGPAGRDGCAGFPGSHTMTEAEKQAATRIRYETSIFAVQRDLPDQM